MRRNNNRSPRLRVVGLAWRCEATGRVVGRVRRFSQEIGSGVKWCTAAAKQVALEGQRQVPDNMVPLVRQVMRQTKARNFDGGTRSEGKIVSVFKPTTD
jgi:transposase, IS5 family